MQFKTGRWTAKTDKCASIYQGNTSLSFNIRAPGDFTVYHDDKVSKFHKDGKVSGKKIRIKSSSRNWISGTYAGSLDKMEFEQEWYQFLLPLLDPKAKEMTISIKEIQWFKRNQEGIDESHSGMYSSAPRPPKTNMPQEHYPPGKLVIIEGPWESKIPISQNI